MSRGGFNIRRDGRQPTESRIGGMSESRIGETSAVAVVHPKETVQKSGRGERMQVSNGRRNEETTMMMADERKIETQGFTAATRTITDQDRDRPGEWRRKKN